jgi:hypothetical protein
MQDERGKPKTLGGIVHEYNRFAIGYEFIAPASSLSASIA